MCLGISTCFIDKSEARFRRRCGWVGTEAIFIEVCERGRESESDERASDLSGEIKIYSQNAALTNQQVDVRSPFQILQSQPSHRDMSNL